MKVLSIFGTRPEAIKMAPVIREFESHSDRIESVVCVTAQHREMLDQVLDIFSISPDYDLKLMQEGQTPTRVASAVLTSLDPVLQRERPDWVLVQGDTTTAAAASLASFYAGIKVGHVEAGLRTYDKMQPFPEEINRRIAGVVADLHFAPTKRAQKNLLSEGVPRENIVVTGNPVIDALHWIVTQPLDSVALRTSVELSTFERTNVKLILVTAHRRENFGVHLESICAALKDIAIRYNSEVRIVYPVHLNPNVWKPVHRLLGNVPNITLTPPLDYLPLIHLMKCAYLVLTDSGGIQEEAPGLGVPVLVLRNVTERPEGVEAGNVSLVGTDRQLIVANTVRLIEDDVAYKRMARAANPYGDGQASRRIALALLGELVEPFIPRRATA
jgi:UDP-N-acetylglucosamine 2-epimerase (non-hydrolysing)